MSKLESYLSKELYTKFPHLSTRQNYRPDWMEGLELDFYIEELKIAAEVQGAQHYSFIGYFHKSQDDFENQKDRDSKKRIICEERRIKLLEIFNEKDADLFIKLIEEKINSPKIQYPELIRVFKSHNKDTKNRIKIYNKHLRNLWLYEHGIIEADEKTVDSWKSTINKGVIVKGNRI